MKAPAMENTKPVYKSRLENRGIRVVIPGGYDREVDSGGTLLLGLKVAKPGQREGIRN